MPQVKLKKQAIWLSVLIIFVTSVAVAQVPAAVPMPKTNEYGMAAPFLPSWIGIWIFALAGAIGSSFMKVQDIDERFYKAHIAKPYLGFIAAMALCTFMTDGRDPPEAALIIYALITSSFGAVVMQGGLVFLANLKNQAAIYKRATGFELQVPEDKGGKP